MPTCPRMCMVSGLYYYVTWAPTCLDSECSSYAERLGYLMLFRQHVSRKAAGKGRRLLEELKLDLETIDTLIENNPDDMESAVQAGLIKWSGGQGRPPTWKVLCKAMTEARMELTGIDSLKQALKKPPSAPTGGMWNVSYDDIVEAHCYFVDIGRTDCEQIRSTAHTTPLASVCYITYLTLQFLYAVDKGLRGRNVLQSLLLILLRICSWSVRPVSYDPVMGISTVWVLPLQSW